MQDFEGGHMVACLVNSHLVQNDQWITCLATSPFLATFPFLATPFFLGMQKWSLATPLLVEIFVFSCKFESANDEYKPSISVMK